jgi:hypothetical protein
LIKRIRELYLGEPNSLKYAKDPRTEDARTGAKSKKVGTTESIF